MPDGIPAVRAAAGEPREARPAEPQDARPDEPAPAGWPETWGAPDDPANVASPWTVPGLAYAAGRAFESAGLPDRTGQALMRTRPPVNTLAVLSVFFMVLLPPAGVVFGGIALWQIRRSGERGFALALTGLTIGVLLSALLAVVVEFAVWLLTTFPGPGG
jgi:hypothetical protein